MRVISLFSGVGGIDLAFERAGATVVAQVEVDEACQAVLRAEWPHVPIFGDISTVKGINLPHCDVMVGGSPCQDFSIAGKRKGLEGDRSGLFFQFARLLEEKRPAWFVFENVPGLLSAGCKPPCPGGCIATHGGAMGAVLGTLVECGYGIAYAILDAQHFGVPQRRRRLFIVGHLGDSRGPQEVLFERESSNGDPAPGGTARSFTPSRARGCLAGDGRIVQSLTQGLGSGGADAAHAQAGWLVPAHRPADNGAAVAAFSIYPESGQGADLRATETDIAPAISATDGGKSTERGVRIVQAYPVAARGRAGGSQAEMGEEGIYNTLVSGDGGSSRRQLVAYETADPDGSEPFTFDWQAGGNGDKSFRGKSRIYVVRKPGRAGALQANKVEAVAYRKATKAHHSDDWERWEEAEQADTIAAGGATQAATAVVVGTDNVSKCLTARMERYDGETETFVADAQLAVRRLVPVECERLQGLPDHWTEGQNDSHRYRQLGNCVAVPVVEWIARRLLQVDAQRRRSWVIGRVRYVSVTRVS